MAAIGVTSEGFREARGICGGAREDKSGWDAFPRRLVVGAFSDGQSGLCLAAARLKHVAGTQWSTRKYMNMDPQSEMKLRQNGAADA